MSIFRLAQLAASGLDRGPEGAWDVSYIYYDPPASIPKSIDRAAIADLLLISAEEANARGIFLSPDGTKLYICGSTNDSIVEYSLSIPFAVSTATYIQSKSVQTETGHPAGVHFSQDGYYAYVADALSSKVYQYTLTTAWDVSTASYTRSYTTSGVFSSLRGVCFKPDGTSLFVMSGGNPYGIYEHTLSTAWDISTASYSQYFAITENGTSSCQDFSFNGDGTTMYVIFTGNNYILQYNLSTAWDISTTSYSNLFYATSETANMGIHVSGDGNYVFSVGYTSDYVRSFILGGFDLSLERGSTGIFIDESGTYLYITGSTGDDVTQWTMSTPWDLGTATYTRVYDTGTLELLPYELVFSPDGTNLYLAGTTLKVSRWVLSTPWDISTLSFSTSFDTTPQDPTVLGLFVSPDGTKLYIWGGSTHAIYQYTMSTAWDLSTISYSAKSLSTVSYGAGEAQIWFKPDGRYLYLCEFGSDKIYEFYLSTAWDLSTASYVQSGSVLPATGNASGMCFSPDGTKLFITDPSDDNVYVFTLGVKP